jgi:checkpoint serine/threonine-protein kinase
MRTPGLAFQPPPSGVSYCTTCAILLGLHPLVCYIHSAGAIKTPGTAKRGLALKAVTPAAEPAAPPPISENQETDEDEYDEGEGALPDPETPFARKKPTVGFVPFNDVVSAPAPKGLQIFEDPSSTPAPAPKSLQIFKDAAELEDEGPVHGEDLFAVQSTQNRRDSFSPFQDHGSFAAGDEDGGEGGSDDGYEDEYPPETQEEPYSDQLASEEEDDDEQQPAAGGRWAPALTPITERTYEPTSTFSNRWTTPLEQRDQSVADTFDGAEAARAAARLVEELRAEEEEETRDLQRMRFAEMYRRESIGLRQSLGGDGEGFAVWAEEGESRVEAGILGDDEEAESSRIEPPEVVDPYTTEGLLEILAQLEVPPTHRDLRPATANQLGKLQKKFKTRGRTNGDTPKGSHKSTSGSGEVFALDLDGDRYNISSKLGEGGFGAVFLATDVAEFQRLEDGGEDAEALSKVAVKVVKPAMVWESYALDLIHQNVDPFILPSIINPHNLYIYEDESYLVLDYSHHGTLLEAVNRSGDLGIGQGLGGAPTTIPGMHEMLVMFFAVELLRTVEGLHRVGFIHGDLKIDNCMVRLDPSPPSGLEPQYDPSGAGGWSTKGIRLIDFGRTIDTNLFPPGQQFTTDWKVDKRDCLEMRQKLPWTYETDYYGLVGIIYCLLFGKYMEMPVLKEAADGRDIQKLPAMLKRYWKVDIWEPFFDMLLNPHQFGTELPIVDELSSMRRRMEAWLVDNSAKTTRKLSLAVLIRRLATAHA